jgi:hypothetical protein
VARGREARRAARAAEEAEMNEGTEGSNDEYSSDTAKCATPAHPILCILYWSAYFAVLTSFTTSSKGPVAKAMCPVPFFGYCPGTPERNRNTVTNRNSAWLLKFPYLGPI